MGLSGAALVLLGLTAAGWFFEAWQWVSLRKILRRPLQDPPRWPSFSVLKPLAGADDELEENLQSHLAIDYPGQWEILVGVRNEQDLAYPLAKAFALANPHRVKLHLQEGTPGCNPKVNQLITLTRHATGEVIALTDAGVRVGPGVLREYASRLAEERVGLTCNIFVGSGETTLGSALDNMTVNSFCAPNSAAAEATLSLTQIVGKGMAVPRGVLEQLGGWETVKDLLAEDQRFGMMLRKGGYRTRLCPTPVHNIRRTQQLADYWERHSRWAMIRFRVLPRVVWFEPLLNPTPWALALALVAPKVPLAWGVLLATLGFSILFTQAATRALRGYPFAARWAALIPLRDLLFLMIWLRGMTKRRVVWRGNALAVLKDSQLRSLEKQARPPP